MNGCNILDFEEESMITVANNFLPFHNDPLLTITYILSQNDLDLI